MYLLGEVFIMYSLKRHIVIFIIVCIFALMHGFMQSMPITTSFHFEEILGISSNKVLNLYSFYLISCVFMQVPVGILFAKYGIRQIVLVSLSIAIIGVVFHQFSSSPFTLMMSRLIVGVGFSTSYLSAVYVAMNFFSVRYLVLLIGIIEGVTTLGSILAATPFYLLLNKYGWNFANLVVIIILSTLLCLAYIFIYNKTKETVFEEPTENNLFANIIGIITNKSVLLLILYAFLNWFIMMSFAGYWIRDYMMNIHGYSAKDSLFLSNVYWGAFLIGSLLIGLFTSSFEKLKKTFMVLSIMTVVTFVIMVIPSVFNYELIVLFCVFAGISGVGVILTFAFIPYVIKHDHQKGVASSVINMGIITGGLVGQYIFGFIIYHVHPRAIYFNNPLFTNSYYLSLWLYVCAAVGILFVYYKLSELLSIRSNK